ncbi:MAG: cytidine deaminase [Bacteroidales bacterium]|nr:cytidine deaminase [Bacteroidales bacterium]
MEEKKLEIRYREFDSREELEEKDRQLLDAAENALAGSYAPYSNFNVGAAVRLGNDIIVKGANQENSAFPSGLCAERTAMFSAASRYPGEEILALALVASQNGKLQPSPTYPCGACRQVMAQYQTRSGKPMRIIIGSADKVQVFDGVESILPFMFNDI